MPFFVEQLAEMEARVVDAETRAEIAEDKVIHITQNSFTFFLKITTTVKIRWSNT